MSEEYEGTPDHYRTWKVHAIIENDYELYMGMKKILESKNQYGSTNGVSTDIRKLVAGKIPGLNGGNGRSTIKYKVLLDWFREDMQIPEKKESFISKFNLI